MDVGVRLRSSLLTLPETVRCGVDTVRRLLCVSVEAVRQLLGPTQGDAVTAIELIGRDPQALLNYLPHPLGRKEAIVAADGRRFRPHIGPPWGAMGRDPESRTDRVSFSTPPSRHRCHVVPEHRERLGSSSSMPSRTPTSASLAGCHLAISVGTRPRLIVHSYPLRP